MSGPDSLCAFAVAILKAADPQEKVTLTHAAAAAWRNGDLAIAQAAPPERPARPAKPVLMQPREMPKRSIGPKGRLALVHALAHIELNAVDLAWDVVARFGAGMPRAVVEAGVDVAWEEAAHYTTRTARLRTLDVCYGDLPAHDGLWEAAMRTSDDLAARMALIPMTFEARGLDTTPPTTAKLRTGGDEETAAILDVIYTDEIKHLAIGVRWFEFLCTAVGKDPHAAYKHVIDTRYPGGLRPPFNMEARGAAGMGADYLRPWTLTG